MTNIVSLKKTNDFKNVYKNGRSAVGSLMVMLVTENNLPINRLGLVAAKKVGNAVARNRHRRLMREVYRLNEKSFKSGFDIVFVARKVSERISYGCMEGCVLRLAVKLGILYRK